MRIQRGRAALWSLPAAGLAASLAAFPPPPVAAAPEKVVVRGDLGRRIDDYMTHLEGYGFAGALLVAKDGQVVLAKGYGLADRERRIRVTPDTVFDIGSITKQFTATAILQLEARGRLKVTDPIGKYFPDVPPDKRAITLHHLLTHTSGLRSDFGGDYDPVPRDEIVRRALTEPLLSKPGERFHYSNAGYSLLASIVELLMGRGYEDFLSRNLFQPAGMLHTGYRLPQWRREDVARGYVDGERRPATLDEPWAADGPWWNLRGNGGIHSTIWDMYRWHVALEGEAILPAEEKAKLTKPYVPQGEGSKLSYAYGWGVATTQRKTRLVTHNGGNGIFEAEFRRYLDEGTVIFIASNAEISGIQVSGRVARLVFGVEVPVPAKVVPLGAAMLARYAGTYQLQGGDALQVRRSGSRLGLIANGQPALDALFCSDDAARQTAEALNRRSVGLAEAAAKGDYAPLQKALGGSVSREQVRAQGDLLWDAWRKTLGEFKSLKGLGTQPGPQGRVDTTLRLEFERGAAYLTFSWAGDLLDDLRPLGHPPEVSLFPISAAEFTPLSADFGQAFRVSFLMGRDGAVSAMEVGGESCLLRARRAGG